MSNVHERMLPTSSGVETATSWSPVGRASKCATEAGIGECVREWVSVCVRERERQTDRQREREREKRERERGRERERWGVGYFID